MELSQNISLLELIKNNPDTEFSVALYQAYNDEIKNIDSKIEEYSKNLYSLVTMMMDFLKKPVDTGIDKILFLKAMDETKNMIITKLNELVFRKTVLQLFEPRAIRKSKPGEIEEIEGGGPVSDLLAAALISSVLIPGVAAGWSFFSPSESQEEKQKIIKEIMPKLEEIDKYIDDPKLKMTDEEYQKKVDNLNKKSIAELKNEFTSINNLIEQKNKSELIDEIVKKENEKLEKTNKTEMTDNDKQLLKLELFKKSLGELGEYIETQEIEIEEIEIANLKKGLIDEIVRYYNETSQNGLTPAEEETLRQVLLKDDSNELRRKIDQLEKIIEGKISSYTPEEKYNRTSSELTAYKPADMAVETVDVKDYPLNAASFVEATKNMSSAASYFENLVVADPLRREKNLISQKFKNKNADDKQSFIGFNSLKEVWFIDYVSIAHQDAVDYLNDAVSQIKDDKFPLQAANAQIESMSKKEIVVSDSGYSYPVFIPDGINEKTAEQMSLIYKNRASQTIYDLNRGTRAIIDKVNTAMLKIINNVIETISDSIITLNTNCAIKTPLNVSNTLQECKGYNDAFKGLSSSYFKLYMDDVEQNLKPVMLENVKDLDVVTGDVEKDITNIRKKNDYSVVSKNIELLKEDVETLFGENTKNIFEITDKTTIREFLEKNTPSFYSETMPNGNVFLNLNVQTNIVNLKFLADALYEYSHQKYIDLYKNNEDKIKKCEESKPGFLMSLFKSSNTEECGLSVDIQNDLRKLLNDKLKIDNFKNIILQVSQIEKSLENNLNIYDHLTDLSKVIDLIGNQTLTQEQIEKLASMKQQSTFEESQRNITRQSENIKRKEKLADISEQSNLLKAQRDLTVDEFITNALNYPYINSLTKPVALTYYSYTGTRGALGFTAKEGIMSEVTFNWGALVAVILSSLYLVRKGKQIVGSILLTPINLAKTFFSSIFNTASNIGVKIIDGTSASAKMIWDNKGEVFYYSLSTAAAGGIWYTLYCMMYETFIQELLPSNEILKGLYFIVSIGSSIVIKLVLTNAYTICLSIDVKTMSITMFGKPIDKSTLYVLNGEKWIDKVSKQEYTITRDDKTKNILPTITKVSETFIVQYKENEGVIISKTKNNEFIMVLSEEEFYKKVVPDKEDPTIYIVDGKVEWPIETGLNSKELCYSDNKWFETIDYFVNFPRRTLITKLYQKINILGRIKDV